MRSPSLSRRAPISGSRSLGGILVVLLVVLWGGAARLAAAPGRWTEAGEGLAWRHDALDEPWALYVVRVARQQTNLSLLPSLAFGQRIGLNTLSSQARLVPRALGQPVAAINGDFYQTEHETVPGDPRGLFIRLGELVSAPIERDCFWLDTQGAPRTGLIRPRFRLELPGGKSLPFGLNEEAGDEAAVLYTRAMDPDRLPDPAGLRLLRPVASTDGLPLQAGRRAAFRVEPGPVHSIPTNALLVALPRALLAALPTGATVWVDTATEPSLTGVQTALGGGPALVRQGRVTGARAAKSSERHPRSALGWNNTHYFLVVVDGRQPGHSDGMTLAELAAYLVELGCLEAINLDGGGSTELILHGRILNRPCYGRERATATGLLVVRAPGSPAAPPASRP